MKAFKDLGFNFDELEPEVLRPLLNLLRAPRDAAREDTRAWTIPIYIS
jgi:hypothetical protein